MKNHKKTLLIVAILLLVGAYIGVQYYVDRAAKNRVDREVERISAFADIRYEDVDVDLFGRSIRFQSVRLSPKFPKFRIDDRLIIDELILYPPGKPSATAESIRVRLNGIRMDPTGPDGILNPLIKELGYADMRVNVECNGAYDRKSRILELTRLQVEAPQIAEAVLRLRLENIDLKPLASGPGNPIVLLSTLSGVSIAGAELRYTDGSLIKRIVASEARRSGQSVDAYVQMLSDRLGQVVSSRTDPAARKMLETIHDFLLAPDSITIRVQPDRPVSVLSLILVRKPDKILTMLGVEVNT